MEAFLRPDTIHEMRQGPGELSQTVDLDVDVLAGTGSDEHRRHSHSMGRSQIFKVIVGQ
jgi:hypothetical protein